MFRIFRITSFCFALIMIHAMSASCHARDRSNALAVLDTEQAPPPGETIVWSPLFQASWDKLGELHTGKLEKIDPPNALISHLNTFVWDKGAVMPQGGYAVYAGPSTLKFTRDTAARVKKQFNFEIERLPVSGGLRGYSIIGVLVRDLEFQKHFFRSHQKPLVFKDRTGKKNKVAFFGTKGALSTDYYESVKVLRYKNQGESFALQIATDQPGEKIIVYRPDRALSLEEAIKHINDFHKSPLSGEYGSLDDGHLHKNDTVMIRYVKVRAHTDFTRQLKGTLSYSGEAMPWRIAMAYQITDFDLFEKGARIRVQTDTSTDPFGGFVTPRRKSHIPRNFICDKPFFVAAWRDKAPLPYFAAWIDGPDALARFKRTP